jgi:hypothetical protein
VAGLQQTIWVGVVHLDTPRKDEHRSDTLTFPSTTIDNISLGS